MTEAASAAGAVDALYALARTAMAFGEAHPSTEAAVTNFLRALAESKPPVVLQFVDGCVFRDRALVASNETTFRRGAELGNWLRRLKAEELAFEATCTQASLGRLSAAFAAVASGHDVPDVNDGPPAPGLRIRHIPHAVRGEETEDVAADVFAAAQLGLAIEGVRELVSSTDWPWRTALGCLRRLDRAVAMHPRAVMRVLELADIGGITRRVTGVVVLTHMALGAVGMRAVPKRVLSHVALALGARGMAPRGALSMIDAARRALDGVLASAIDPRQGAEPHRAQTVAALLALVEGRRVPGAELLRLAYDIEAGRAPADVEFELSTVDRFAELLRETPPEAERATWLRVVIHALGVIPPGARVRLSDGRVGVVLDAGSPGDPMRPTVLVGNERIVPDRPVHLLGGAG